MDKKPQEVEGFKITPEHREWYKQYQQIAKVHKMIKDGLRIEYGKVAKLEQMVSELEGKQQQMLMQTPEEPTYEIPGQ